jgi:transmembrane sensor
VTSDVDESDSLRDEAADWLVRIQAAPGDAALHAGLDAWLASSEAHRKAYRSVERVWRLTGELQSATPSSSSAGKIIDLPRARLKRRAWGLAATVLAACLAFYFLPALKLRFQADHLTGIAEVREFRLEDGSIVHLDATSAIAVRYGNSRREVELLAGQAFFQVVSTHDQPFVVVAGDVTVTVKGTAFDVGSTQEGVAVAVQSGIVEVSVDGGRRAAMLKRGDRLTVDRRGEMDRSEVAPEDVASWREYRLVVDGASLGEVVEELGRHYRGVIVLGNRDLAARRITGVFDLRRPLEALHTVARTQHSSVTEISPYLAIVSPSKP